MKLILVTLFISTMINTFGDAIVRLPRISEGFSTNLTRYQEKSVAEDERWNHFVKNEFEFQGTYEFEWQGRYNYFVVYSKSADGGRILRLNPIPTRYFGIPSNARVAFTDVGTGKEYLAVMTTVDERRFDGDYYYVDRVSEIIANYFLTGVVDIEGETYNILILFRGTPRYPRMALSWGEGSDAFGPGEIVDSFEQPFVGEPNQETNLDIEEITGEEGVPDGTYLFVDATTDNYHDVVVDMSQDLVNWPRLLTPPYLIYGQQMVYKLPPVLGEKRFFRVMK